LAKIEMSEEHIIALGGGGFSMEDSPLLDDYILQASRKDIPKVCFIGTASGDSESNQLKFFQRFSDTNCKASTLTLFRRTVSDLEDFACSQDVIYVGGGNTVNMLAVWKAHGFDLALRAALSTGTVLAGLSAGSICWFEQGVTDSFGTDLRQMDCLGFLRGSNCPHYDGEANRRPSYHKMIQNGMQAGYAADDGVGLHFVNGELSRVVSSREAARGYRVDCRDGEIAEEILPTIYLGNNGSRQNA